MPIQAVSNAFTYYQTWWDAPVGVKALLHLAAFAPIASLIIKLNAWTESAIFFDGSALGEPSSLFSLFLIFRLVVRLVRGREGAREGGGRGEGVGRTREPAERSKERERRLVPCLAGH